MLQTDEAMLRFLGAFLKGSATVAMGREPHQANGPRRETTASLVLDSIQKILLARLHILAEPRALSAKDV
ncbi:hypothetical protein [Falsiroseomonas sp.]|uniref:hypothetical protein n=1 Tax=Falsiroseomonas sp. TaxID=2870721 RepID=UPI003F6E4630